MNDLVRQTSAASENKNTSGGISEGLLTRRRFIGTASAAAALATIVPTHVIASSRPGRYRGALCFFSKHLAGVEPRRMAEMLKQIGFSGVDLTVRKGGHVTPERAGEELPKAVTAIREASLEVPMITTNLTSTKDPAARSVLEAAGKLSIPLFKPGYYKYDFVDVRGELRRAGAELRGLAESGRRYGIQMGYHNHADYMGASVWDTASVIEQLDPRWAGYYFDVRHATVEGGGAGWKIAAHLVAPRLKMIAVKDFYWGKTSKGWQVIDCPLGDGMVDWRSYFDILAKYNFQGPISFHFEYDVGGKTSSAEEDNMLNAAQRDLNFVTARLKESYGAA